MNFSADFGIKGELGTCFKMNEITMTNDEGDEIVFINIRLATFVDTACGTTLLRMMIVLTDDTASP